MFQDIELLIFPCNFTDINECAESPCGFNANCTNTIGSFLCECETGFEGNGTNCTGINRPIISNGLEANFSRLE